MSPRDTGTGAVLEEMILPALRQGGYDVRRRVPIGDRLGRGKHIVDLLAEKNDGRFLISLKWQQVSGTAEQKVPFEVICLVEAMEGGAFNKAYLVLGGEGWKLRGFYTSGGLERFIPEMDKIHVVTLESFIAIANRGQL